MAKPDDNKENSTEPEAGAQDGFDRNVEKKVKDIDRLLHRLDNSGVSEYVRLSQNLPKVIGLNFLSGVAKGLGFTIGTTIVLAILYKIVSQIISMNIPYLTEMLMDLIELVKRS